MKSSWIYAIGLLWAFFLSNGTELLAQGNTCATAEPFCSNSGITFPAGTNQPAAPAGNNYGCLGTQPNPAWYYLEIDQPGNLTIDLSNSNTVDVDFILYGPFSTLAAATAQCGGLGNGGASGAITDCSYSGSAFETIDINGAVSGQVYILLITNFSNQSTQITANQTGGTGSTNCSILLPCAPVGFNNIVNATPYDCTGPVVNMTAYPYTASPGNLSITPGFHFEIQTDAFSATQNTLTVFGGPNGTGPVVAYWGPTNTGGNYQGTVPNSALFSGTVEYLSPSTSYSLRWCDSGNSGSFTNEIRQSGANLLISNAPLSGVLGCVTINLGTPVGAAVFTGPGVVNNANGTGTWNPAIAGGGVHTITYHWNSTDGCVDSMSQTVIVCCDTGYTIIDPLPDTLCLGDTVLMNVNLPGGNSPRTTVSNSPNTTIPLNGYIRSSINVAGIAPLIYSACAIDSVCFTITGTQVSNLNIALIAPNGDSIDLTSGNGGIVSTSYTNSCFSPSALIPITNFAGPFTAIPTNGLFLPEQPFANLNGSNTNGTWSLGVDHIAGTGAVGPLVTWSIRFAPSTKCASYTWAGPNLSCTTCPNPTATPTVTSDYRVTIVDGLGCRYVDTATVVVLPTLGMPAVTCGATTSTQITFNWAAVVGAAGYEVSLDTGLTWIPANGLLSHTVTGLSPSTPIQLLVRATGGSTLCPNPIDTQLCVTLSCPLIPSIQSQTAVSCHGGTNGTVNLAVSNAIGVLTFQQTLPSVGTAQATGSFTGLAAGAYTFEISDATLACSVTQNVTITEPSAITVTTAVTNVLCNGFSTGTATVSPSGGVGPYTFVWSDAAAQTTPTATGLAADNYNVTTTDANGCTAAVGATITQPSAVTVTTASVNALCFGGSDGTATATVSGGTGAYAYVWSDAAAQTTATATGLSANTYTVSVTDGNSCLATQTVTVGQPAVGISLAMSSTVALCFNGASGTATATPAGGTAPYSFVWENGQTTGTATALVTDTYSVTMTDGNGCQGIDSVFVGNGIPIAQFALTASASCFGSANGAATLNPSGGAGGFTFVWDNGQTTQTATGLLAGTYCVTATDANACTIDTCVTVNQPSALGNAFFTTNNISCSYSTNGQLTISLNGGTAPYTFLWSNGQNTQTATGLPVGTHFVTVTDANSCTYIDSAQITAPAPLTLNVVSDSVNCRFGSDGSANAIVGGGTFPYFYNWSNAANTPFNNNLVVGTYVVTVTDFNGCTITGSATIGQPATSVVVNILNTSNAACFGAANGSIDADALGGTPNYTFAWSNGQFTQDLTGLTAGTYTITASDALGCTATASTTVGQPTQIALLLQQFSNYNGAAISCPGASNGSARVTASGGVPAYTYAWSGPLAQNTTVASGLAAGTYAVTVTDAAGCAVVDSITLADPVPLAATEQHVNLFCFNDCDGEILVNATPGTGTLGINGYEYRILGPGQVGNVFSANNSFFNLCAGTYTVEVRDGNNCVLPLSITLTQPTLLTATATATAASCNGTSTGSATANPAGGVAPYTYLWSNGQTGQTATNLAAGGYAVTITDANGCDVSSNAVVTQPTALTATTSFTQPSCFGATNGSATVVATGGTAPYTYAWSNSGAAATTFGLPAGTHSVTITDARGCGIVRNVVVTQPAVLTLTITGNNLNCAGNGSGSATVTTTGGTAPFTYLWSNGQTTATATGLNVGVHSAVVTDVNGCQQSAQVTLTQPTPVVATLLSTTNVSCNGGSNGSATISAAGGSAPYSFTWPNGQHTATATGLAAGSYLATVTDANGCSATVSATITQPAALNITQITTVPVNCKGGADGSASAFINGGSSPYTFAWSNGGSGQTITALAAGTYRVTVTDGHGCSTSSAVIVTEPASALVGNINTSAALCQGAASGQLAAIVSGGTLPGTGDYFYQWSNGANTAIVPNVSAGNYTLTVTDAHGCTLSLAATVGQAGNLSLSTVGSIDALCPGSSDGTATVTAAGGTGGLTYQWSNGQINPTATGLSAGDYTVTVTDANGCSQSTTVTVGEGAAIVINTNITNVSCFGGHNGRLDVTSAGISLYEWSTLQVGNPLANVAAGQYGLTVTDIRGCRASFVYNVTEPEELLVEIAQISPILCHNDLTGHLEAAATGGTAAYNYQWSNGANSAGIDSLAAGSYSLTITDANGCTVSNQLQLGNPTALGLTANTIDVRCVGDANGRIQVSGTGGSTTLGMYEFSIDSTHWQTGDLFPNLTAGTYHIYVRDNNGCVYADSAVIEAADPFYLTFFAPQDTTIIYGDTINLVAVVNDSTDVVISWTDVNAGLVLDSTNYQLTVHPFDATVYRFHATSLLGCEVDTTVIISVAKPRRAAAPQAFTPNRDGNNDAFYIQGDEKVSGVALFRVYDRWGELVFEAENILPNDPQQGWDGTFKGKEMNSGPYAWYAEVKFIDDHVEVLRGDVTLLR